MRSFIAVEISCSKIIDSISEFQSRINIDAKPVESQNLHFTLQFLGNISQDTVEKTMQSLNLIKFSSFKVTFRGVDAFPKLKFPRVIWIGIDEDGGNSLMELAKKIERVLIPIGLSNDKQFKPHVTVFRIKNKIRDISKELDKFRSFEFGTQEIKGFKLKQSILSSKGPIYYDLMEVKAVT
jgi:2'-5' RNA ligase